MMQTVVLTDSTSTVGGGSSILNGQQVWGVKVVEAHCMNNSQTYADSKIENALLQTGTLSTVLAPPGVWIVESDKAIFTAKQVADCVAESLKKKGHYTQVIMSKSNEIINSRTSQDSGGGQARGCGDFGEIGRS